MFSLSAALAPTPPARLDARPRDQHGRILPFYAQSTEAHPEPWIDRVRAAREAYKKRWCFTCGEPLGTYGGAFVLSPTDVINQDAPEPPSHVACAEYSVLGWLALNHPAMCRQSEPDPAVIDWSRPGPHPDTGVVAIYSTDEWERLGYRDLFSYGPPFAVTWWTQGRRASYPEALDGLVAALRALRREGEALDVHRNTRDALTHRYDRAVTLLPGNLA